MPRLFAPLSWLSRVSTRQVGLNKPNLPSGQAASFFSCLCHGFFWGGLIALLCASPSFANGQEVRIGVLAFRPIAQTLQQWQPTADYLNSHVEGGYHFTIEPLYFPELDKAIDAQRFDFVLTNPEHYVTLRAQHDLAVMATLMPLAEGHPVNEFGGVILARADNAEVNSLQDIRGKVVSSVAEQSFAGYLIQRWTLFKHGIQISAAARVRFTGMPQDKVVLEVLNRQAAVGFVRTGVLESMVREGKLNMADVKIINQQSLDDFPQRLSTELYPEWAFSSLPKVSAKLNKRVAIALLNIAAQDAAAQVGKYYGFTPPGNYAPVEAVMLRLKLNPDRDEQFDWRDVMRKYELSLWGGALAILIGLLWAALYLMRTNRHLRNSYHERKKLDEALQLANATLEEKVAQRTAQLQASEARFRKMFEHHASAMLLVDPQTGAIVSVNQAAATFYGYSIAQMQGMNIAQINMLPQKQIDQEIQRAQMERRNSFFFTHRLSTGEIRNVEVHSSPVELQDHTVLFSIVHDITERTQLEEKMHELAFYDPLTQLPNRRLLLDRVGKALASAKRTRRHGALMFLDLDHFKNLNDLHGHDVGDLLLVEVAKRLLRCVREEDSVARLGGDEFVVLLEGLAESTADAVVQAELVAEKIRASLAQPYSFEREGTVITHHSSSSVGVTLFRDHEETLGQLLKWTDIAMYRAKQAGRNAIRFFDPAMQQAMENRAALEADLHIALAQSQFELFYQVQVNLHGRAQGAEVLVRWRHPERGLVSPAQFIPLAEETGLIVPLGTWVLHTACAQLKQWQTHPQWRDLQLAVNVSAKQFRQPDFVTQVQAAIEQHGIHATSLKLELTESLVLEDVDDTIAKMAALQVLGVSFSMDDFGTGYSSLAYLKRLPLDQLKIDQSFVRNITTDQADLTMVMIMVDLGMSFELDVIAEGVETAAQLQALKRAGCVSFQGYLFSKPVPIQDFESLLVTMATTQA